mmetsp:Transcript_50390/g.69925  ORF Transcript_50390/g.69925 Transcript_50390/m.69925 type:complete len:89 (-) Transcript_50390:205-471(-)
MLMNAALKQSARLGQRRFQSTTAIYANRKANLTVRNNWLQDPSTYPLIACMAAAGALVVGVGGSCLMYSPDVQISPSKRGAIMRTWEF